MRKLLAISFIAVLREWLECQPAVGFDNEFELMVNGHLTRNLANSDICCTHEFCDSNEAMLQAWKDVFGFEFILNGTFEHSAVTKGDIDTHERQNEIFNKAWSMAKIIDFDASRHTPEEAEKLTRIFFRLGGETLAISELYDKTGLYDIYDKHSTEIALGSKELYAKAPFTVLEEVYAGIQKLIGEIKPK
jgi:hypothetical protein